MSRQPDFHYFSDTVLEELFSRLGHSLGRPRDLARAVQKMSDFYIQNPDALTPWQDRDAQVAYLAYFLPLGLMRWRAVLNEALSWGFLEGLEDLVDFGAGPGTASLVMGEGFAHGKLRAVERASEASTFHRRLLEKWPRPKPKVIEFINDDKIPNVDSQERARSLLLLSYVLTEHVQPPAEILKYDSVIVMEPSTHQDGRRLLEWREQWRMAGFHMWAPCTHQKDCPLLHHSKKDWCHDRVHWQRPPWWIEMEKHLPFKNNTITFSYLIMSRRLPPAHPSGIARLVGDSLPERGKTRQMCCRGPNREFLSWLQKAGAPPEYPRGELVKIEGEELKGAEIRAETQIWTPPKSSANILKDIV